MLRYEACNERKMKDRKVEEAGEVCEEEEGEYIEDGKREQ